MIDFKNFPTTRYQGSKRKVLPFLYDVVQNIKFETVLDACGGTGSVSYLFKKMGKVVTYNDKLYFNHIIGKAIIENSSYKLTEAELLNLCLLNPKTHYPNFINNTFEGYYYLNEENEWLDRIVTNIRNMKHRDKIALEYKKNLAFYSLFQACMIKRPFNLFHRKNLDLRLNDVVRSFGNKSSWDKSFEDHFLKFAQEGNKSVFDNGQQCNSINKSILEIDPSGYDLIYIDPPYIRKEGTSESSDYFKCYHFLEGLVQYDQWKDMVDYNSINRRLKNLDREEDFNKENILETIEKIIYNFRNNIMIFSYKVGGKPSIDYIVNQMKKHGKRVYRKSIHYNYALNHQNGNALKNKEVLIIGI